MADARRGDGARQPFVRVRFGVSVGLFAGNIMRRGTPDQVEKYGLPALKGDLIGAWALTEPGAGSDALGGMKTRAIKDGDHYVLNGARRL